VEEPWGSDPDFFETEECVANNRKDQEENDAKEVWLFCSLTLRDSQRAVLRRCLYELRQVTKKSREQWLSLAANRCLGSPPHLCGPSVHGLSSFSGEPALDGLIRFSKHERERSGIENCE
jgi:hypothetical protein